MSDLMQKKKKKIEAEKHSDKDGNENNTVYDKTMEHSRKRVDIRLVNNRKDYLKWTSKPSFVTQNIFGNNLVAIWKIKITFTLNTC